MECSYPRLVITVATRTIVTFVCDLCESDDMVETHTLNVDGKAVEADACLPCWQKVLENLAVFSVVGRPITRAKVRKADVVPFPGESWKFTSHALIRLGERHLNPTQAALAAEKPDVSRPGREPGTLVHTTGPIKVAIDPTRRLILTVARRSEEIETASPLAVVSSL